MHSVETKVTQDITVTCGEYTIQELLTKIAYEAHMAIIYLDENMTAEEKLNQTEGALYRILDLLGD